MPGRPFWDEQKIERLRQHVRSGGSVLRAAVIFQMSTSQVRHKARESGFPFPTLRENQAKQKAAMMEGSNQVDQ
jgi:hypothetical protein